MLTRRIPEFRTADLAARDDIVKECTDRINRGWRETVEFDREIVESVSGRSAILGHAHTLPS